MKDGRVARNETRADPSEHRIFLVLANVSGFFIFESFWFNFFSSKATSELEQTPNPPVVLAKSFEVITHPTELSIPLRDRK